MSSIIEEKTLAFSKRTIDLYKYLTDQQKEFILSKQILRSGTSIGANVVEAEDAESRADFRHKLGIALKETSETVYWLKLLFYGGFLTEKQFKSLYCDVNEIRKIIIAILKSTK